MVDGRLRAAGRVDDLVTAVDHLDEFGADGEFGDDMTDRRVSAGVLLSLGGTGDSLSPFAAERLPFMRPHFAMLDTSTLVVAGDHGDSPLSTRGPEWLTDGYELSPGARALLTVRGGEHSVDGVAGYAVAETTDEDPAGIAVVQQVTTAFLRAALGDGDLTGLVALVDRVTEGDQAAGTVTSK